MQRYTSLFGSGGRLRQPAAEPTANHNVRGRGGINLKVITHYFGKNIILLILSIWVIIRITRLLYDLNYMEDNLHMSVNLFSISLALLYIIKYLDYKYTIINPEQITSVSMLFAQIGITLTMLWDHYNDLNIC